MPGTSTAFCTLEDACGDSMSMGNQDSWTIGRLLEWTVDYLTRHRVENARLDAEVLLAAARGCQRIDLYASFDVTASPATRTAFRELVRRRAQGVPVAYLVGHREFYSLDFRTTPDVLIPRPETELLVVAALDRLRDPAAPKHPSVIDVGTGSGVIAICVAKHVPTCRMTAVDISRAALQVARDNASAHGVADRIELAESDLFAALPAGQRYDMILSNPPYVSRAEWEALPDEIKRQEPQTALNGGQTGMVVIERLVRDAVPRLQPGGWLILELGPTRRAAAEQLVRSVHGLRLEEIVKDLAGLPRVLVARCESDSAHP